MKREGRKDVLLRRNIGGSSKSKATAPSVSWRSNNMATIMIHWKDKGVSPMEIKNAAYRGADSLSSKSQLRMGLSIGSTGVSAGT